MNMLGVIGAFILIATTVCSAVPFSEAINEINNDVTQIKGLSKCAENGGVTGIMNCLALRTVKSLQLVARKASLEVVPGVTLNNEDPDSLRVGKELNEEDLPLNPQERADKLYEMLLDNSAKVLSGRTLKIKLPEDVAENMSRALEEGRKKKKGMFPLMFRFGAKMMGLIPAALAFLGLLATKALIVAKIAFVLSVIVFFQNIGSLKGSGGFLGSLGSFGHGWGSGSYGNTGYGSYNPGTWTSNNLGGSSQYPYARSIDVADKSSTSSAQDLAYANQK